MPALSSRGRGRRNINEINMVPFIDVMLVLLIIFMVTAPMMAPSVVNVPSIGQADRPPDKPVQITVQKDGSLSIKTANGSTRGVELKGLATAIKGVDAGVTRETNPVPVVIAADRDVKYDNVVKVMDQLQRDGVKRVGLSVQVSN